MTNNKRMILNKKFLITMLLLILAIGITYVFVSNQNEESLENINPTSSTDRAEYQKCVEAGGKVSQEIAPFRCFIDGKSYYDGNF